MNTSPDSKRIPGEECRLRFGRTLTAWLTRAGWAHDTPAKWGKVAGFPAPKNSTYSQLQRGMIDQPKPLTFYQLGLMNDRLARRDYGVITDRKLKLRIEAQEPICTKEGRPWTAVEFFAHYMGLLDAPDWVHDSELPSTEDAERITREMVAQFQATAEERMLGPMEAWQELSSYLSQLSRSQMDLLRSVLSGWHTWTPEELVELGNGEPGSKVQRALNAWQRTENSPETNSAS